MKIRVPRWLARILWAAGARRPGGDGAVAEGVTELDKAVLTDSEGADAHEEGS